VGLDSSGVVQEAEKGAERTGEVCAGDGQQDELVITATMFTRLRTRRHLCRLQHQALAHLRPLQLQTESRCTGRELRKLPGYTGTYYHLGNHRLDDCYLSFDFLLVHLLLYAYLLT